MTHPPNDPSEAEVKREDELPMEARHLAIENSALKLSGRARNCGRNAYRHLRMSWKLKPIDSEMSLFRAITAEEEAATALIYALKSQRYPGSDKLNPWNHNHKLAVMPFLDAIQNMLFELGVTAPQIQLSRDEKPSISLAIDLTTVLARDEPTFAWPDHPLNFVLRRGDDPEAQAHMFEAELQALAEGRGFNDIMAVVSKAANLRNKILYADDHGYPTVDFSDNLIFERRRRVSVLMTLTIAVLQTPHNQLFVVQCLEAFLRALKKIDGEGFDFRNASEPIGEFISVSSVGDVSTVSRGFRNHVAFAVTQATEWPPIIRVTMIPS